MPLFVGIDLGTTNSAAVVFDGEAVREVRGPGGSTLTPSVVHIGGRGRVTVGERARRLLDTDPANTRTGFKRLLGTSAQFIFPAAREERTPTELSAELLRALREAIASQIEMPPNQAVITVPALFELPQCRATTEAAMLAGFDTIELVQEPVASALAAGWTKASEGRWLVFDLGGGTFDATLLEESDGFLRVVGHDGHNFLGGRDMDQVVYGWLRRQYPTLPDPEASLNPEAQSILRMLLRSCEEAKIDLSQRGAATIAPLESLELDGEELIVEAELSRTEFERLITPLMEKAIVVCRRLLSQHDLAPSDLAHVVMVGGPAAIPLVRSMVESELGSIAQGDLDPMTLVARGAALQAAALGLPAGAPDSPRTRQEEVETQAALFLRHPSMCRDRYPVVVGKVLNPDAHRLHSVVARRGDWQSEPSVVDEDHTFLLDLLLEQTLNRFELFGFDVAGEPVPVSPAELSITHGVSIGDPPVARSVGVARSNNVVAVYFERGDPLPAERSFQFFTVEAVKAGTGASISIPLVQGEYDFAHLCQRIGEISVDGRGLPGDIEVGTEVEISLRMDRGGHLEAKARFPKLGIEVSSVALLMTPEAEPEAMRQEISSIRGRLADFREGAFESRDRDLLKRLAIAEEETDRLTKVLEGLSTEAKEPAHRARRDMLELSGEMYLIEQEARWPEVEEEIEDTLSHGAFWLSTFGLDEEQKLYSKLLSDVQTARERRSARRISRLLRRAQSLIDACFNRSDDAVTQDFEFQASRADEARSPRRFRRLVQQGEKARSKGDMGLLRNICHQLHSELPGLPTSRRRSFGSGVQ